MLTYRGHLKSHGLFLEVRRTAVCPVTTNLGWNLLHCDLACSGFGNSWINISALHEHPMGCPTTLLHHNRRKRTAEYYGTSFWNDVPQEYCLFNDAQLFFGSILPFVQAKATARWLQITQWELLKVINTTNDGFNIIKEKLSAIRMMAMQHCYVLDLTMTMQGVVCEKIGTACWIFIPENDTDNGTLLEAIQTLHNLQKKIVDEGGAPYSWFSGWVLSLPSWMSGLWGALLATIVVLLLIYCVVQLILACCRRIDAKAGGMFWVRTPTQVVDSQGNLYHLVSFRSSSRNINQRGECEIWTHCRKYKTQEYSATTKTSRKHTAVCGEKPA